MKKENFAIGLLVLILLTIIIYNWLGFEITLIFLITDLSVGISYQFAKINKFIDLLQEAANEEIELEKPKFDTIILLKTNGELGIEEGYIKSYEQAEEQDGGGYYFETTSDPNEAIKFSDEEELEKFEEHYLGDLWYEKHKFIRLTQKDYQKIMEGIKSDQK